jgi:hypothetical protein
MDRSIIARWHDAFEAKQHCPLRANVTVLRVSFSASPSSSTSTATVVRFRAPSGRSSRGCRCGPLARAVSMLFVAYLPNPTWFSRFGRAGEMSRKPVKPILPNLCLSFDTIYFKRFYRKKALDFLGPHQ